MREELKAAGLRLLRDGGLDALKMRDAAIAAGYSAAAPYQVTFFRRHGIVGLRAVVAEGGFELLCSELSRVRASDPQQRVLRLAVRYTRFAQGNPDLYRVMFNADVADRSAFPDLGMFVSQAYGMFRRAVSELPKAPDVDVDELTLAITLLLHGWSEELINNWIVDSATESSVEARTKRMVGLLLA